MHTGFAQLVEDGAVGLVLLVHLEVDGATPALVAVGVIVRADQHAEAVAPEQQAVAREREDGQPGGTRMEDVAVSGRHIGEALCGEESCTYDRSAIEGDTEGVVARVAGRIGGGERAVGGDVEPRVGRQVGQVGNGYGEFLPRMVEQTAREAERGVGHQIMGEDTLVGRARCGGHFVVPLFAPIDSPPVGHAGSRLLAMAQRIDYRAARIPQIDGAFVGIEVEVGVLVAVIDLVAIDQQVTGSTDVHRVAELPGGVEIALQAYAPALDVGRLPAVIIKLDPRVGEIALIHDAIDVALHDLVDHDVLRPDLQRGGGEKQDEDGEKAFHKKLFTTQVSH